MAMAICHCGGTIVGGRKHVCKPMPFNALFQPKEDITAIGKVNFPKKIELNNISFITEDGMEIGKAKFGTATIK